MSSANPSPFSPSSPVAARAGAPSAMEEEEYEEWSFVSTPVKPNAAVGDSPLAPNAPARPPSAASSTSKRLKLGTESPKLDLSDQMEAAAPAVPKLDVKLQLECAVPVRQEIKMKVLVSAMPPPLTDPSVNTKFSDVVFVIDASVSARQNGCMEASKSFLAKFLADSVGLKRRVRMILFGTHIQDLKIGGVELCEVTEETLPTLLAKVNAMKAWHPGTDIGTPVLEAISIIKRSRTADAASGIESPAIAHVLTLTDGACHSCDYSDPEVLIREVRETGAPEKGIQTHYIGFSNDVNGSYMKNVSDSGNLGVFHAAPNIGDLPTAFETVLNFLGCEHTFTFEATTFAGGVEDKTVFRLGALRNERTKLIDIDVFSDDCGEHPVISIQMLQGNQPIGQRVVASLVFEDGNPLRHENAKVLEAMKALKINEKVQHIFASCGSTEHDMRLASYQISKLAEEVEDKDGTITRGLTNMAACAYRSCSAPSNFGAQVASQQAHGLSLLQEERDEEKGGLGSSPRPPPLCREYDARFTLGEPVNELDEIEDDEDLPVYRGTSALRTAFTVA